MKENKVIELRNNDDRHCMICGDKTKPVKTLAINRKKGDNIVAFGCCKSCMRTLGAEMVSISYEYD